jgi:uncharacterized membrane protein YcaP (DUF421 family)
MDSVLRPLAIYVVLLILFRIAGKRSLAQITTFDFVLLLIISETTQQALLGDDRSVTNAVVVMCTLIAADIALSIAKQRWPALERWMEGMPVIVLREGRILSDRMQWLRVDEDDILTAAREAHGIERLDQIKYAVVERSGGISIVPMPSATPAP